MPASVKTFSAFTILSREWLSAVGSQRHQRQGTLVVTALFKKDIPALLTDRGVGQMSADSMAAGLRKVTSTPVQKLIDAGVIDPNEVAVYVYYDAVKDQPVGKVNFDGTVEIVAHFRYESGWGARGLYVEPITA